MQTTCFHCGEPVIDPEKYAVHILGQERPMCCPGCAAVARLITSSGLSSYYQHRTQVARSMSDLPNELEGIQHYDIAEIQDEFTQNKQDLKEVILSIDGVNCAACAWLIERHLQKQPGVKHIQVNTATARATLTWDHSKNQLSQLLTSFQKIGYRAHPFQPIEQEKQYSQEFQSYMRRMGVAGLATMQVMMYAIALYMDIFEQMPADFLNYFRWVSLLLTLPVVLYAATPFYKNAWQGLKHGLFGMDLPVSIALILAFATSCYATVMQTGQVYFESVSMFAFFLLVGRFFEMRARRKAVESTANLTHLIPSLAARITPEGLKTIPAKKLQPGYLIQIKPGSILPADGIVKDGKTSIDESLLTGESQPLVKAVDDIVFAGTLCIDQPITVEVTHPPGSCQATQIVYMQEKALQAKPSLATLADQIARYFVIALLIVAGLTGVFWYIHAPDKALWIMLSVLVATCPCALSLATPTAYTCATQILSRAGVLIKQGHVLETLCQLSHLFFDKTGTLTTGHIAVKDVVSLSTVHHTQQLIDIAASLEQTANHPIADAIKALPHQQQQVKNVRVIPGDGITGDINGVTYAIGHGKWLNINTASDQQAVYLAENQQVIGQFTLTDQIRSDSPLLIKWLHQHGYRTTLLTGDPSQSADQVAQALHIKSFKKGLRPEEKLREIQLSQKNGDITAMVGDGVNDAPVLTAAHVSFAVANGSDLAKNSADALLIGNNMSKLITAIQISKKTKRIIIQNLIWALGYNAWILPLAVTGHVHPWMAALGMSVSSLIVIGNSLRLLKQ